MIQKSFSISCLSDETAKLTISQSECGDGTAVILIEKEEKTTKILISEKDFHDIHSLVTDCFDFFQTGN